MSADAKILGLFQSSEIALPEPPVAEVVVVVCPHCDQSSCEVGNCEVGNCDAGSDEALSSTEARMARCLDCGAEFVPALVESKTRETVRVVNESRRQAVMRAAWSPVPSDTLIRLLNR